MQLLRSPLRRAHARHPAVRLRGSTPAASAPPVPAAAAAPVAQPSRPPTGRLTRDEYAQLRTLTASTGPTGISRSEHTHRLAAACAGLSARTALMTRVRMICHSGVRIETVAVAFKGKFDSCVARHSSHCAVKMFDRYGDRFEAYLAMERSLHPVLVRRHLARHCRAALQGRPSDMVAARAAVDAAREVGASIDAQDGPGARHAQERYRVAFRQLRRSRQTLREDLRALRSCAPA